MVTKPSVASSISSSPLKNLNTSLHFPYFHLNGHQTMVPKLPHHLGNCQQSKVSLAHPSRNKIGSSGEQRPSNVNVSVSYIMCMGTLSACMSLYHMHTWYLWKPEPVRSPGAKVTGGCKLAMKIWSSEELPVLVTTEIVF